jgi:putative transcriptional regulator
MPSLQGHFVIASPHLDDPNFMRAVILMIQHDEEGAFGLILNRPCEQQLADVLTPEFGKEWNCKMPVYLGGPVPGPLIAIHNSEEFAEQSIIPGVFLSARREAMDGLIQEPFCDLRVFHGYSGWGGGQLEDELEAGGWLVSPASAEDVFSDVDELWSRIARRINLDILAGSMDLKHVPDDPSWN